MKAGLLAVLLLGGFQSPGGLEPKGLVGAWQGEGRYLDAEGDRVQGPVPFFLRIDEALVGDGTVGEARICEWRLERGGQVIRIQARLEGRVRRDAPFEKDHLTLVVTEVRANRFTATFQLRCDEAFDPTPDEGRVILRRLRPLPDPGRPGTPATGPSRP